MEKIIIIILLIVSVLFNVYQGLTIKSFKETWSPEESWYVAESRDLKESFIFELSRYLGRKNILISHFLEHINENKGELEDVVDVLLRETSMVQLFLPKKYKPLVFKEKEHYAYRIGSCVLFSDLLLGFEGSSKQYAYNFDEGYSEDDLIEILEQDSFFKDVRMNRRIYFLVIKNGKLYYTDTHWWDIGGERFWWPINLIRIDKVSDDGLQHLLRRKDDVLILPKKIK